MKYMKQPHRFLRHLPATPLIFIAVIPVVVLDIYIEIYHRIAYIVYGLPYEKRGKYIKIDRHRLQYLNFLQKIFCAYCGYVNGVLQYWVKIVGETEKYWCSIKHEADDEFCEPPHHKEFLEYGDVATYKEEYESKKTRFIFK